MVRTGDSQAKVTFCGGDPAEQKRIRAILDGRFYGPDWHEGDAEGAPMVGHVDITLAKEPEGWRVVDAVASGDGGTDWRPQVIEALRKGGITLTNP